MRDKQIATYIELEDYNKMKEVAATLGLSVSSFLRFSTLKFIREIIKENREDLA